MKYAAYRYLTVFSSLYTLIMNSTPTTERGSKQLVSSRTEKREERGGKEGRGRDAC